MSKSRLGPVSKMARGRSHQSGQRPFLAWLMTPGSRGKPQPALGEPQTTDSGTNAVLPASLAPLRHTGLPAVHRVSSSHMPWLLCTCWSLPGCSPTPSSHSQLFVQVSGQMSPPQRLLTRSQLAQPPSPTLGPVLYATPISSLSLLSRRWPVNQSQLTLCFCTAHELRLVFMFLNGWKRSFCDTLGVRSVPGQGSSYVLPARLLAQAFILAMERTFAPLPLCVTSVKKSQGTGLPRKAPISVMRPPPVETCLSRPPSSKPDKAIPTKWKTANSRTTKPFFQKQFN